MITRFKNIHDTEMVPISWKLTLCGLLIEDLVIDNLGDIR